MRGERQAVSRRWMVAIIVLALVIGGSKTYSALTKRQSPLDAAVIAVTTPVVFVVKRIGDGITYTIEVLVHFPTLLREKRELKAENDWLTRKLDELAYVQSENDQLRALMNLKARPGFTSVKANVIARPYDIVLDTVLIGVGQNHKVQVGNLVVNELGVVGTISEVFSTYSRLTLAVSEQSYLWAATKENLTEGLLVGAGGTNIAMTLVLAGASIGLGDGVYTMGRESVEVGGNPRSQSELLVNQPKGVYIGLVVSREASSDGFLKIQVEPAANPNRLGSVLVLVLDK